MGVKICTFSPTTISGSMSKDPITFSSMPPCFSKPSDSTISAKNEEGLKTMADSRKIVYPPPLVPAPLSKSAEKRGRGRPRGSKNKDPYRPFKPPANGMNGNQMLDPNAISLHDIGPATSHEDGNRPSTSTGAGTSTVRTKEFDYRRKVHERLTAMMQNEHSKILCLLPEVENTTTSQMSIFIRRLRTQFWPEGSKKSNEIPTKPKMPYTVAEPLYGALCEDLDAFRKSASAAPPKAIEDYSKANRNWLLDPDLTDESCDSSGDEFTEDEADKHPAKKRRCLTRNSSEFKYYGLQREISEAKDMVTKAKDEKQLQIKQLKATLEALESEKEAFQLGENDEESGSARCRPLKNRPSRDVTKLVMLPNDVSSEVLDCEQEWHSIVSDRIPLPQEFASPQDELSNFNRQSANSINGFEARRRNRKLVRAAMIARKRGQFVPADYMLLKRQEELWKTRKRIIKQRAVMRMPPNSTLATVHKKPQIESEDEPASEDSDYDYEEGSHSRRSKCGKSRGRPSKHNSNWSLNGVRRTSIAGKSSSKRQSIGFKESEFEFDDQMDTTIKQVDYKEIDVPTWRRIDMDTLYPDYPKDSCNHCTGDKQPQSLRLVALHHNLELAEKRRLFS